jgi:hypothetical protein
MKYKAVPGMHMHPAEREALRHLAKQAEEEREAPVIVNIGIAAAYGHCSMHCLRAGSTGAMLIGIDIEEQGDIPDSLDPSRTSFLIGDSSEVLCKLPFLADVVFVDGDHSEAGVTKDARALFKIVREGGYVAFHDYGHYGKSGFEHVWGVKRAVDKTLGGNEEWEFVADIVSVRIFKRIKWSLLYSECIDLEHH